MNEKECLPISRVRNDWFDARKNFTRGRSLPLFIIWFLLKGIFLQSAFPWPNDWKCALLRLFGASIGTGVCIKPRVNVHFPWKLYIGDHTWIGEGVEIYNFELVSISRHCCLSQRTFLCAANHDFRNAAMSYRNAPIIIHDGVWVGACSFVGPGVTVGVDTVITAGAVVTKDLPHGMICSGNPCVPLKQRWSNPC